MNTIRWIRTGGIAVCLLLLSACSIAPKQVVGQAPPARPSSGGPFATADVSNALLYVSDEGPNVVNIYSAAHPRKLIGQISDGINVPDGMDVDRARNLYVTNASGNTVQVYAPGGTSPIRTYTQGLSAPINVVIGKDGTLYVANNNSGATFVVEYPPGSMTPSLKISTHPGYGSGLAVDGRGRLYVSYHDSGGHGWVYRYPQGSTTGVNLNLATHTPAGLALDRSGDLIVADATLPAAIQVFPPGATQPSQVVTDGVGNPFLISLDARETHLYVTDEYHTGVDVFTYPTVAFKFRLTGLTVPAGVAVSPPSRP